MPRTGPEHWLYVFLGLALVFCGHALAQDLVGESQRAKQLMLSHRYAEAERIYRHLASELPDQAGIQFNLALALHSLGQYSESTRTLEAIRTEESTNFHYWLLLGEGYLKLHNQERAIDALQRAASLDGSDPRAGLELASAFFEDGQFGMSHDRYQLLAAQHPESAEAWAGLLLSAARLHKPDRVQTAMQHLLDLPDSTQKHVLLAKVYSSTRQTPDAVRELRAAEKLSPGNSSIEAALARVLIANRQFADAVVVLTTKVQDISTDPDRLFDLGDALLQTGDFDGAISKLKRAVELSPGLLSAQAKLGEALLRAGWPAAAVAHLRMAEQMDDDGAISFQLATAYRRMGEPVLAAQVMARREQILKRKELSDVGNERRPSN